MTNYKMLFVGVGSIAKRHIKNLFKLQQNHEYSFSVDVFRSGSGGEMETDIAGLIANIYTDYAKVPKDYHIIFITNPTQLHLETLGQFHNNGRHFFIEKPLCGAEQLKYASTDFLRKDSVYYVACPLRYTNVIQYVKNNIDVEHVRAVRSISSSYLPDWRPGIDYRKTYSARKELGGGVSIDLIHEWDYLYYLFGDPAYVQSMISRVSNLDINSDDIAVYIAAYRNMVAELHLDYFGRFPIRKLELFMDDDTVECDLINSTILYQKENRTLSFQSDRDTWQIAELQHFLGLIENKKFGARNIETAKKVLNIAGGKTI